MVLLRDPWMRKMGILMREEREIVSAGLRTFGIGKKEKKEAWVRKRVIAKSAQYFRTAISSKYRREIWKKSNCKERYNTYSTVANRTFSNTLSSLATSTTYCCR